MSNSRLFKTVDNENNDIDIADISHYTALTKKKHSDNFK